MYRYRIHFKDRMGEHGYTVIVEHARDRDAAVTTALESVTDDTGAFEHFVIEIGCPECGYWMDEDSTECDRCGARARDYDTEGRPR